jgi:hypothetical protein
VSIQRRTGQECDFKTKVGLVRDPLPGLSSPVKGILDLLGKTAVRIGHGEGKGESPPYVTKLLQNNSSPRQSASPASPDYENFF